MEDKSLIRIGIEENEIVIRCKVDDLIFIAENDPENNYQITDKKEFGKQIVFQLQNMESQYESHINVIEGAFEKAYNHVYEDGDDCMTQKDDEQD